MLKSTHDSVSVKTSRFPQAAVLAWAVLSQHDILGDDLWLVGVSVEIPPGKDKAEPF